ncbi:ABC transporter ATP-binding protein [Micromonospora halophytica]|uniref:ABC-2 type transport system ATP-binding protein n=1 Tax=Micromonospora halophytica TaxID=47864 RepID=A0A1C5ILF5_9ACTN|nr:ATP-binding cassette domain-containing protein [Micromonospora halophytica]SCG59170.1 ABC-2 type transport system ATP-binding protein [Micromonospora halophytica]
MAPLIEATGLVKEFRRPRRDSGLTGALKHLVTRRFDIHRAVDGIDLRVGEGESVAYAGPNGAGKSTTVKLLTGILVPTAGEVRVAGVVPHRDRIANAKNVGVVFGQRTQLWWDLPVGDTFELLRDMYRIPAADYRRSLGRLTEVLEIGPLLPVLARKLSLGQRMRADLAAALLHQPHILYLDEPTIGLDLDVKDRVRTFLRQLVADGTTILLTTHDIGDIEEVCGRIVVIDEGRIRHDGPVEVLRDALASASSVRFQLSASAPLDLIRERLGDAEVTAPGERELVVRFDRTTRTAGAVAATVMGLVEVRDLRINDEGIADLIRRIHRPDEVTARSGAA